MARRIINIGSSVNKGDGDALRSAFDKVNDNFEELYARDLNTDSQSLAFDGTNLSIAGGNSVDISAVNVAQTLSITGNTLSISDGNSVELVVTASGDTVGSVFADDSTLLVDGVNARIPAANLTGPLPAIDGSNLTGITISSVGTGEVVTQENPVSLGSLKAQSEEVANDGVNNTMLQLASTGADFTAYISYKMITNAGITAGTTIQTLSDGFWDNIASVESNADTIEAVVSNITNGETYRVTMMVIDEGTGASHLSIEKIF